MVQTYRAPGCCLRRRPLWSLKSANFSFSTDLQAGNKQQQYKPAAQCGGVHPLGQASWEAALTVSASASSCCKSSSLLSRQCWGRNRRTGAFTIAFQLISTAVRPWDAHASTANLAQGPELLPYSHLSVDTTSSHT